MRIGKSDAISAIEFDAIEKRLLRSTSVTTPADPCLPSTVPHSKSPVRSRCAISVGRSAIFAACEFGLFSRGFLGVLPLAIDVTSASPANVKLIESLLDQEVTRFVPRRFISDRAADSDYLRENLDDRGIELISPHRAGRVRPALQDGRPLRRYRTRRVIERTIGWLQSFRRLVTRYEFPSLFHGFAKLACLMIALRRF